MNHPRKPGQAYVARPSNRGPLLLKIAIICITCFALIFAVRSCQRLSSQPFADSTHSSAEGQSKSEGGARLDVESEATDSRGVDDGGVPQPEAKELPPREQDTTMASDAEAGTSEKSQNDKLQFTDELIERVKSVQPSRGAVFSAIAPDDLSVYEALMRQLHWGASTLYVLTSTNLESNKRELADDMLSRIDTQEAPGPFYEFYIRDLGNLSAVLTCNLVASLVSSSSLKSKALSCSPAQQVKYETGYPAVLGTFAEAEVEAWCQFLCDGGVAGVSSAQRIEAELRSLPKGPSLQRSATAFELQRKTLSKVAERLRGENYSPEVIQRLDMEVTRQLRHSNEVFYQYYIATKAKNQALRYALLGEHP